VVVSGNNNSNQTTTTKPEDEEEEEELDIGDEEQSESENEKSSTDYSTDDGKPYPPYYCEEDEERGPRDDESDGANSDTT
jgi:hypothetical protein